MFQEQCRLGVLKFNCSNGYADTNEPLFILSKASRSARGRSHGVVWSAWINLDGATLPLEGVYARARSVEDAIVVGVLLNVREAIDPLLSESPVRNQGTKQPELSVLARDWRVPDISASACQGVVGELVDAFHAYRLTARGHTPDEAHTSRAYRELLLLGDALWRL